jgi:hypothetical protein
MWRHGGRATACAFVKEGVQHHVKTKRLQRALAIPLYQAVGVLETLWLMCQSNCDDGRIGKFTDEEIAAYLEWGGDAAELVAALAESGWLDPVEQPWRYEVHDWMENCPEFIWDRIRKRDLRQQRAGKSAEARKIKTYVEDVRQVAGQVREVPGAVRQVGESVRATQPNPTQPHPTNPPDAGRPDAPGPDPPADPPAAGVCGSSSDAIGSFNGYSQAFQVAWDGYPLKKRVRKVDASKAWGEAVDALVLRMRCDRYKAEDWLSGRLRVFCRSPAASSMYCVGIATWLASGKYDDPDEAWQRDGEDTKPEKPSQYPKLTKPKDSPNGRPINMAKNVGAAAGTAAGG